MKFATKCITKTRDNNDNKIKKPLLYGNKRNLFKGKESLKHYLVVRDVVRKISGKHKRTLYFSRDNVQKNNIVKIKKIFFKNLLERIFTKEIKS